MPKNLATLPLEVQKKVDRWVSSYSRVLHFWRREGDVYLIVCGYFDNKQFKLNFLRVWETPNGEVVLSEDRQINIGT